MPDPTAIDTEARHRLARLVRRLAASHISNVEFEDSLPNSTDPAIHESCRYGLWPLYDDLHEHKLSGPFALTDEGHAELARVVLFLRSNTPYRWPPVAGLSSWLIFPFSLVTFGWIGRMWRRWLWRHGDESVWPFFTRAEYEQALGKPVFLGNQ